MTVSSGKEQLLTPSTVPYGDQSMPLGGHLAIATRACILSGAYVDIFSLLNMELDDKDKDKEDEKDKEQRLRWKPDHSWPNWLAAYTI